MILYYILFGIAFFMVGLAFWFNRDEKYYGFFTIEKKDEAEKKE